MQFASIPSGGSFIKPEELAKAQALLVEVERFEHQVPTKYGPKDTATAKITAFYEGREPEVQPGVKIQQTILARDLEGLVGKATIVTLVKGKSTTGNNDPWLWRDAEGDVVDRVVDYAKEREEKAKADMADAPSF